MASKQLGKLRQWGKEVISTRDKTTVTEEFKQLEKDVELRKAGIEKIQDVCAEFHVYLHKKKEYPNVEEGVKMLPMDALGVVMVAHGEEFGKDSAFGQCLTRFGRAQCKIATLQESFASFVRDKYLTSLEKVFGDIEEYEMLRKKLDSRRLTYDAAVSKLSKTKKDKDIKEAEEEHVKAKFRYEEASSEVQTRMRRIQANELRQLKDLTNFLQSQIQFTSQCLTELREVENEWCDESSIERRSGSPTPVAPHSFAHEQKRAIASVSRRSSRSNQQSANDDDSGGDEESEESDAQSAQSQGASGGKRNRHQSGGSSKPPSINSRSSSPGGSVASNNTAGKRSRSGSIQRRKRSDSAASSVASSASESTKRSGGGVTGWLSGSTRGKKDKEKRKDKDRTAMRAFASLENDDVDDDDGASQKSAESDSRSSATNNTNSRRGTSISGNGGGTLSRMFSTAQRPLSMNLSMKSSSSNSSFVDSRDHNDLDNGRSIATLGGLSGRQDDGTIKKTNIAQRAELEMLHTREYEPSINSMDGDNLNTPLPPSLTFPFIPFSDAHQVGGDRRMSLADNNIDTAHDRQNESESENEDAGLLLAPEDTTRSGVASSISSSSSSPFEPAHTDISSNTSSKSRLEIGNASGLLVPQPHPRPGLPPPLPSRKQSTRKVPPPPPPPPPPARRSTPSPNFPDASSSSSSLNLSGGLSVPGPGIVSFPPPPPPPSRERSRNVLIPTESLTISPFDN